MKVTLVATVKDAATEVGEFLVSIAAQTRLPDEVVIVDGGSSDGTVELLRRAPGVTLIEEPGANIARGRNVAVRAAAHDLIACSDADCVLAPNWVERIVAPIEDGADVSMGVYRPLATGLFEVVAAAISIKEPEEIREEAWMPSSRSVAFRKEAFEAVGGYPEWLAIGEDMELNHRWRRSGMTMRLAREAVVFRRPRPNLGPYWRQFSAYAAGDAEAGMFTRRHLVRFAVYGALASALVTTRRAALGMAVVGGAAYAARPVRRAWHQLSRPRDRAVALAAVPALMAVTDLAKMAGYVSGLRRRRRGMGSR